ncbi:MAG: hypothetical protein V5A60_05390, partial [Haloarculaceae archaeon]
MLRPERMSRVSVTGSKRVMDDAIEAVHDLHVVDVTDYDGGWEGFDPGDPTEGADEAAERLVTVRSLKSILGVEEEDAGPARIVSDAELETELEETRQRVNELDDRRDDIDDELRSTEERIDAVEPFVDLGIDLDLLSGYENVSVAVGEGDATAVKRELGDTAGIDQFEVFTGDGDSDALAVFAYPAVDLSDALVSARFSAVEVPDIETVREVGDGDAVDPSAYVDALGQRRRELESKLSTVEGELEEVRVEVSGFLLAAEEQLAIEVQKREAPLSFATTENAFVAEGWIPTTRFVDLVEGLQDAVGDHVEVEELERADYDGEGHVTGREEVGGGAPGGEPTATDGGEASDATTTEVRSDGGEASSEGRSPSGRSSGPSPRGDDASRASSELRSDGGHAHGGDRPMSDGEPPVIQDNPGPAKPFEALVEVINRPKYSELDPTVIVFLTFPAFFGFMIGDLGYGILYMAIGWLLYSRFESDIIRSLGGVALWAGGFTALFGVLYGEIFGLHQLGEIVWPSGSPPLHKGLSPEYADYALGWLVISLLAGVVHLTVGWIFDFYENLSHGVADAVYESGSWLLMMFGLWTWIFAGAFGSAPALLYGSDSVFNGHPFAFGFTGFPEAAGLVGLAVFGVGLVLLVYGEPVEGVEFLNVLVNVLSYTRLAAVLLAKAGMAFVVNLLFFGVWVEQTDHGAAWHFGVGGMPSQAGVEFHGAEVANIMFGGLLHGGIGAALLGLVVLVVGHLLVLALGITSAGLQAIRLEYVEFFG